VDVLAFFKVIDRQVPRRLAIHVICDNLATHKAPEVAEWFGHPRRARWHLHFTPTSSSWLNLVERWFKELTDRKTAAGDVQFRARTDRSHRHLGSLIGTRIPSRSSGTPKPTKSSKKSVEDAQPLSQVKSATDH